MTKLYVWQDITGAKHHLIAKSLNHAKQQLLQSDEAFFNLKLKGFMTRHRFKRQDLIIVTKQLATMQQAGLPIAESLALLANEHPLAQWQWLLDKLKQQITKGESISTAMSAHGNVFPAIYIEVIATGELTGQLDACFHHLASQLENAEQLQKRVKKALRYPLFLFGTTFTVTLVMLMVVLPKFSEVYQNFDAQLPAFTQTLIDLSNVLQHYFIHIIALFIVCYLIYHYHLRIRYSFVISKFLLHLPIVGHVIQTASLAQIFQTLFMTQKSGIPLLLGIASAQKTAHHLLFEQSLKQIIVAIEQGQSFSQAISQQSIYPSLCHQLIHVGEESGTLDMMLARLADFYQQKSAELTDNLSQKIEPVMMSIMAIIVGGLVIAMYLPVFQLGSVIG